MASPKLSFRRLGLSALLLVFTFAVSHGMAAPHRIQKRDIFSDIANFFDNLEMQVDMDIFQPIANFFTEVATTIENDIILPAENFFMQANTVIVAALYNIDMLVADIGHAIESDIISDVVSIENFAVQVGQEITNDAETVFNDVQNEFNNVITPALNQVGQEIGQAFQEAGADIVQGLDVAGQYLEDHPDLIAQIVLTVALGALTIVQPELAGADGALIADIATEAASEVAGDLLGGLASDAVNVGADFVLDDGAEEVVSEADMTLFEMISGSLDKYTSYVDNVGMILNFANDANTTLGDIAQLAPVTQQTISDIQNAINPLAAASAEVGGAYSNFQQVLDYLNEAGKVVAIVARDEGDFALEIRANTQTTTSKSASSSSTTSHRTTTTTTTAKTTASTKTTPTAMTSSSPLATTTMKASSTTSKLVSSSTTSSKSTSTSATPTLVAPPSALMTQYVHHHFLNTTTAAKNLAKLSLKMSLKGQLGQSNMTTAATYMSFVPQALAAKNLTSTIPYPPSASAHLNAISHQIAIGNATAYNSKNQTVRIQMDANAPTDPCLGVPKVNCFGNELGNPYCHYGCASRWYNRMNITPLHYK